MRPFAGVLGYPSGMGKQDVSAVSDDRQLRAFMRAVLEDVNALERMLETDAFESGVRRVGAEQEMFLIDRSMNAAPMSMEVLATAADPRLVTELAQFNLEANLTPLMFGGDCLARMERELCEVVAVARSAAKRHGADILLAGILPTLRKSDLGIDNLTPHPRYAELNRSITKMRGGAFHVAIKGTDELDVTHDTVMLESCNTSFQIHFQVHPRELARLYNIAQAVTAPVLAAASSSPVLFGRRLWAETRIALFARSIDARSSAQHARGHRPRVSFGEGWIRDSVLEIFREDIARFRVVLSENLDEDPMAVLDAGGIPKLSALRLHNGTVYRWNRVCYGANDKVAHLRIENRALPAGPTIVDEVANAAFYFGLMAAAAEEYGDIASVMPFEDAKNNFFSAARYGLKAQLSWMGGETLSASELIVDRLLPMARAGLAAHGIDEGDIDRYLGVVSARVSSGQTGTRWMLDSLAAMGDDATPEIRARSLAAAIADNQRRGDPVHTWSLGAVREHQDWRESCRTVGQLMSTDLFTVRPQDVVDLAANVMDWEHIRHVPVEDDNGHLVGLVTHRTLLRMMARGKARASDEPIAIHDVMKPDPVSVSPATPTLEAMRLMREHALGCMPVVEDGKLVGIITERDLINVSTRLLEEYLKEES